MPVPDYRSLAMPGPTAEFVEPGGENYYQNLADAVFKQPSQLGLDPDYQETIAPEHLRDSGIAGAPMAFARNALHGAAVGGGQVLDSLSEIAQGKSASHPYLALINAAGLPFPGRASGAMMATKGAGSAAKTAKQAVKAALDWQPQGWPLQYGKVIGKPRTHTAQGNLGNWVMSHNYAGDSFSLTLNGKDVYSGAKRTVMRKAAELEAELDDFARER